MAKIGVVVVPYILNDTHFNFMAQTIFSLFGTKTNHQLDVIAIVNHCRPDKNDMGWIRPTFDFVEINDQNNLARAWNKGITKAFERGADYVLVPNLDLLFHERFLDNLVSFAQAYPQALIWSGVECTDMKTYEEAPPGEAVHQGAMFSCFLIDHRLFEELGQFDEQFSPAYHEDSDMLYRAKLRGFSSLRTESARYFHFDRMTIKGAKIEEDENFLEGVSKHLNENLQKYKNKWGGPPGQEVFAHPYQQASLGE